MMEIKNINITNLNEQYKSVYCIEYTDELMEIAHKQNIIELRIDFLSNGISCSDHINDDMFVNFTNLQKLHIKYDCILNGSKLCEIENLRDIALIRCENIKFESILKLTQIESLILGRYDMNDDMLNQLLQMTNLKHLLLIQCNRLRKINKEILYKNNIKSIIFDNCIESKKFDISVIESDFNFFVLKSTNKIKIYRK